MSVVAVPAELEAERSALAARRVARPVLLSAVIAAAIVGLVVVAALALDTAYVRRALPGVSVGGIPVGSLDEIALRQRLRDAAASWPSGAIEVRFGERSWHASDAALGLVPDLDAAVRAAASYGRSGPLAVRLGAWGRALAGGAALTLPLRGEGDAVQRWTEEIAAAIERPVQDGGLRITSQGVVAVPPESGRYVDRPALAAALGEALAPGDRRVSVPTREVVPAVDASLLGFAAETARAALRPVVVRAGGGAAVIDAAALAGVVVARRVPVAGPAASPARDAFVPAARFGYELGVDEAAAASLAESVASTLDRPARNAGYALRTNGSLAVLPAQEGSRVDRVALASALRGIARDAGVPHELAIATTAIAPAFGTAQAEREAAAMTRIAFFEAYAVPDGDAAAVEIAVPPGEAFAADRLSPWVARALLGAALAAGLEASVESAAWRNDTAHAILARAVPTRTSVVAELWGVPGDRSVSWGPPDPEGYSARVVRVAGATLHRDAVPGPLGPPRTPPEAPREPSAVTAQPAGR